MRCPAERYSASPRPIAGLPELDYPFHDKAVTVTTCGRICFNRKKINLSQVFAGQTVGIKQVDDRIWLASFMHYDLGYFDDETCRLEPLRNPFGRKCYPCSGMQENGAPERIRTSDPQIRSLVLYPAELRARATVAR